MESKTEQDEAWLENACWYFRVRPTDRQVDEFLEAVQRNTGKGIAETTARSMAFTEVFE